MCGIFFSCSQCKQGDPPQILLDSLRRRGPDSAHSVSRLVTYGSILSQELSFEQNQSFHLTFSSTVLSLRGDCIVSQPLEDPESGSVLCWNGEAWKVNNECVEGNDAEVIFSLLLKASHSDDLIVGNKPTSRQQSIQNIANTIGTIAGPYAFLFYDAEHHHVFYGRDPLGRRSLAFENHKPKSLLISSVCDTTASEIWAEVEADGIYMLDLHKARHSTSMPFDRIPRIMQRVGEHDPGQPFTLVRLLPLHNFAKDIDYC